MANVDNITVSATPTATETAIEIGVREIQLGIIKCVTLPLALYPQPEVANITDNATNVTNGTNSTPTATIADEAVASVNASANGTEWDPLDIYNSSNPYCLPVYDDLLLPDINGGQVALAVTATLILLLWFFGWWFILKYTLHDGYMQQADRKLESEWPWQRRFYSFCIYAIELPQMFALAFPSVIALQVSGTLNDTRNALRCWLLRFGTDASSEPVFTGVATVTWMMMVVLGLPVFVGMVAPKKYVKVGESLRADHPCVLWFLEWLRDFYVYFLCIPITVNLLAPLSCTSYLAPPGGAEPTPDSMTWASDLRCWSYDHIKLVVVGVLTFLLYYASVLFSGVTPSLVMKTTDLSSHGRYMAASAQCKIWLAITFILFEHRYEWLHLACMLVGMLALSLMTASVRPYIVEMLNFNAMTVHPLGVYCVLGNFYAAVVSDSTASSPTLVVLVGTSLLAVVCLIRCFVVPETKIKRSIAMEGGHYSGGVSLGTLTRHGFGEQIWEDGASYNGTWIFGSITGRGVLRLSNGMYYEGFWWRGQRHGLGKTTIVEKGVESYEGYFKKDEPRGFGRKMFSNGEIYEGEFLKGMEHGRGTWTFEDKSFMFGEWQKGMFIPPDEARRNYKDDPAPPSGTYRYGVMHGEGVRCYNDGDGKFVGGCYTGNFVAGARHGKGHMLYNAETQEEYEGVWRNDMRSGVGTYRNPGIGETYEGSWVDDKMDGYGTLELPDSNYTGNFLHGKYEGYGHLILGHSRAREEYKGSFRAGQYHGKGYLEYASGDTYDGGWVEGVRHGVATTYTHRATKAVYEGRYDEDVPHGEGSLLLPNVGKYTGDFERGERTGTGEFRFKDGSLYTGKFENGLMHGQGCMVFEKDMLGGLLVQTGTDPKGTAGSDACGDGTPITPEAENVLLPTGEYDGDWRKGVIHGKGRYIYSEGGAYSGAFSEFKRHGYGSMHYPTGEVYAGEWVNGLRQGTGQVTYPDGRVFTGQFYLDCRHGAGKLKGKDGAVQTGYYRNDVFVGLTVTAFNFANPSKLPAFLQVPNGGTATPAANGSGNGDVHEEAASVAHEKSVRSLARTEEASIPPTLARGSMCEDPGDM